MDMFPQLFPFFVVAIASPAETLAQGAYWLRLHLFNAPGFKNQPAEELDVLAGKLAPMGVALAQALTILTDNPAGLSEDGAS